MTSTAIHHSSSYRDPSGFIFEKEGILYRQVNIVFKDHFDQFIQSGCYKQLADKKLLIPHEQVNLNLTGDNHFYTTIRPEKIPFISYPYEWSFDMLKDAALLTLRLLREALSFNMVLKDASPYNIQWHKGHLVFIDTLSFEKYEEKPWIAYRQFCETFLAPLLLMHYSKKSLHQLQMAWPEGIPLDITRSLLPYKTRFSLHIYLHIHLHAKMGSKRKTTKRVPEKLSKQKLLHLISSLEILLNKLQLPPQQTAWSGYYEEASLRNDYLLQKKNILSGWFDQLPHLETAVDLGANEGVFSKLLSTKNINTLAADFDPACIDKLYGMLKQHPETTIQPLLLDLANPSPAMGVNNEERDSFINRANVDMALCLALVHHLAIGKNIPFLFIARFFERITGVLIIEFVPPEDEKIKLMLSQKPGLYLDYTQDNFEKAFQEYFITEKKEPVADSGRTLYFMKKKTHTA
jgi:hypothetical protein